MHAHDPIVIITNRKDILFDTVLEFEICLEAKSQSSGETQFSQKKSNSKEVSGIAEIIVFNSLQTRVYPMNESF